MRPPAGSGVLRAVSGLLLPCARETIMLQVDRPGVTLARSRAVLAALAMLAAVAVIAVAPSGAAAPAVGCKQVPVSFRAPLTLGRGFEPSIEVDSVGTIYVTAARGPAAASSSPLWRSVDDGRSFQDVPGLSAATDQLPGFEGDIAVDGKNRLYFTDLYLADSHFARYSDRGRTLDFARPAVASIGGDDRPWLAAHHDGVVYYMVNSAFGADGRQVIYRSVDGGMTFDPRGYTVPRSYVGFIDADPRSDYVYAAVNDGILGTGVKSVFVSSSPDRGRTWRQVKVADFAVGNVSDRTTTGLAPIVSVSPLDGTVYVLWIDGNTKLHLAESRTRGRSWTVRDITPFAGTFGLPWVAAGPSGDVGIVFVADPAVVKGEAFFTYAMVWSRAGRCRGSSSACRGPASAFGRLPAAATTDGNQQRDFFQVDFSADNALQVAYTKPPLEVDYTRQVRGPNLGPRDSFCGHTGRP